MSCISFICLVKVTCLYLLLPFMFPLNFPQGAALCLSLPPTLFVSLPHLPALFPFVPSDLTQCVQLWLRNRHLWFIFSDHLVVSSLFACLSLWGLLRMSSGTFYHGVSKTCGLSAPMPGISILNTVCLICKPQGEAFGVCRAGRLLHSFEGGDACVGKSVVTMTGTTKAGMENL